MLLWPTEHSGVYASHSQRPNSCEVFTTITDSCKTICPSFAPDLTLSKSLFFCSIIVTLIHAVHKVPSVFCSLTLFQQIWVQTKYSGISLDVPTLWSYVSMAFIVQNRDQNYDFGSIYTGNSCFLVSQGLVKSFKFGIYLCGSRNVGIKNI